MAILQRVAFFFVCGAFLLPLRLWAQQCAVDPLMQYTQLGGDTADNRVHVEADSSESDFLTADFSGEVKVRQGDKHLFAPNVKYVRDESHISAPDGVILGMPTAAVQGKGGEYFMEEERITFENAQYYLSPKTTAVGDNGSRGDAQKAEFNRQSNIDQLEDVTWSTCERVDPSWQLKAKYLTIDNNQHRAVARDATFRIGNTPIFWLPYFSFPTTSDRTTGFLIPSIGSSDERGLEVEVPFYWNIAPNRDATFTLRPMTKRGLMLGAEYRFMTAKQYGELSGAILPSDNEYNDKNRWQFGAKYRYDIAPNWELDLHYQDVSDIDYQEDLAGQLDIYDEWYLDRYARVRGAGDWGNVMFRVQDYERVSPDVGEDSTPYSRMPQILYTKQWKKDDFRLGLTGEAVRFTKDNYGDANRFSLNLEASYRLGASYGFIEPKISALARYYDFNPENGRFRDGNKTLVIPTLSVDSGLVFEREFSWGGEAYTQTLEPRLFYLYTPYHDQSDIPNFDSDELTKSWDWLFARNRFTGGDKVGDAHQLTTAISTRFYRNSDGFEKARLSIGQIQYFRDRRVGLNSNTQVAENNSVLVTEGQYYIDRHWSLYGLSFWDPNQHQNERNVLDVRYNLDADRYIHFGHRYNQDDYDQLSLGGGWRFHPQWRVFGRYDYSLREDRGFNTMLGVEYDDCCWAWRLVGRHYRNEPDAQSVHNTVYLEFIFKGLGNMGSRSGKLLSEQLNNFKPLPQEKSL